MTRQNNEDPALLQGIRKSALTRSLERGGGGKWVPVNKEMRQLVLNFESAENPKAVASGVVGGSAGGQISAAPCAALLSKSTAKRALSATMTLRWIGRCATRISPNAGLNPSQNSGARGVHTLEPHGS